MCGLSPDKIVEMLPALHDSYCFMS